MNYFTPNNKFATYRTNQFMYYKKINTFITEVSTLKYDKATALSLKNRNSSDFKFIKLVNPETKKSRLFSYTHTEVATTDNSILGWCYKSNDGIKILIIND